MKVKKITNACMAGVLLLFGSAVHAGDIIAGKARSASCAGCHGAQGISSNPLWPNLADPMMTPMAKPLTDADIQDLAAWYNSL